MSPQSVSLAAPNPLGILHGLQTFLQLVKSSPQGFVVPAVVIDDQPRFPWRGPDAGYGTALGMPLDTVRQTLDGMEAVRLNVFHWHLSEDQGFRVESKTFPLLQEKGSDGLYYTQDEIRGISSHTLAIAASVLCRSSTCPATQEHGSLATRTLPAAPGLTT